MAEACPPLAGLRRKMSHTKGKLCVQYGSGGAELHPIGDTDGCVVIADIDPDKQDDVKAEDNANELVRRWDAFEDGGKVEDLLEALEQSREIFSKKLRAIRRKQDKARNLNFFIESNFWGKLYNQFFELRLEIEQLLDKKNLNEFCVLMAFMPEEKREVAIGKAKMAGG